MFKIFKEALKMISKNKGGFVEVHGICMVSGMTQIGLDVAKKISKK